ncbi:MAG: TRAP transporter large permease [Aquamicrobium sp.]|nr:TRAP transporter large permease [Aquamicrobium sp.]
MSTTALMLVCTFGGLVLFGAPFAIALGVSVIVALSVAGMEPAFLAQQLVAGSQSFSLLAVPLFILAGGLMSVGGISERLITLAKAFVGHRTGGLAMVAVIAAMIFAAISGSAPATTAAIGSILIPAMVRSGYSAPFATSVTVSAGVLGPLIPPSIAFVIWGMIAEQSISKLFLAGITPGVTIAAGLLVICYFHARRHAIPRLDPATWGAAGRALWDGRWALFSPVLILGGIYGGIFTPTEAAGVSCLYALFVGFAIERKLTLRNLMPIALDSLKMSSMVMAIIVVSTGFGVIVAQEQIAVKFATYLTESVSEKWLVLLLLNLAFFLLAAVMDEIAIMVILGPLLIAISSSMGVDPIQFGAIIVTNVAIGMAAPPIGYCLFVGMAISGLKLGQISRAIWPQIVLMLLVLMLTTYIPQFSTFLVN